MCYHLTHWGREKLPPFSGRLFKCIFLNENVYISIEISLEFVLKGSINNIPILAQIMAWRRPDVTLSSEPMMVRSPTHICVIRPQWVNGPGPTECPKLAAKFICVMIISIMFVLTRRHRANWYTRSCYISWLRKYLACLAQYRVYIGPCYIASQWHL